MIPLALAVLIGTVCLQLLPELPSASVRAGLLLLAMVSLRWRASRLLAACLAGFLWAALHADRQLAGDLPAAVQGQDMRVQGSISSLPEVDGRVTRFLFSLPAAADAGEWRAAPRTLRLSWYDAPPLQAGQTWQLTLRLKRRHGFLNPGGFDYAGWLLQNGINATGYVRKADNYQLAPATGLAQAGLRLRQRLDQHLQQALAHVPQAGLLRALTIGARDGIPGTQWTVFRATGTTHLVAISGMHISLVAGLAFMLMRWLWSRSRWLTQGLAAPRAAALAALLMATLYALLAGFSIPTQRAWLMVLVLLSGVLLGRPTRASHTLALALLAVTVYDPFAVLSPGFWLSFAAVAIIFLRLLALPEPTTGIGGRLQAYARQLTALQWALSLGLLPLTLLFFGQAGWVAPLANLFAVPWTSLVLMPLLFAALLLLYPVPGLAALLYAAAGWSAARLDALLGLLAGLPGTQLGMPGVPVWVTLLACAGITLLLLPRGLPHRQLGWLALLPLLGWSAERPPAGTAWFTLLDVGQGLAAVVQTRTHTLVFDTGPRFSDDFDTGAAVVTPFLGAQGIRHIDLLIISHGDNDHRGGATSVAARLPIHRLLSSVPERIDWRYSNRCRAGQAWTWDGVRFRMLHPAAGGGFDGNNASCVLLVEAANGERLLLPGDIEAAAERALVESFGDTLRSEVLVAPHHGSRSSSTAAFIAQVAPDIVLIPAGHRNRYGFPHPTVSQRYRQSGAQQWLSGAAGALQLRLGDARAGLQVSTQQQRQRRYWHDPAAVPPRR